MRKVIVVISLIHIFVFPFSTEDKRNGAERLRLHKLNCKKSKDRYAGNTTYCLSKDHYTRGVSNRSTATASRCATTEEKIMAKKVVGWERPKALKNADKPKAIPKGLINKIGKLSDALHMYISFVLALHSHVDVKTYEKVRWVALRVRNYKY